MVETRVAVSVDAPRGEFCAYPAFHDSGRFHAPGYLSSALSPPAPVPRGESTTGRLLAETLEVILPNFQLFDLSDSLAAGDVIVWAHLLRLTVYAVGYVAAICVLAAFSFSRREL